MSLTGYQVGWCDDGEPLLKDASCRKFEGWLNAVQTPQECTELRQLILENPRISPERKAFYGRALNVTARLSLGLFFNPLTGAYAAPTP